MSEQPIHNRRAGLDDGPDLVSVDQFGDGRATVADEVRDVLKGHAGSLGIAITAASILFLLGTLAFITAMLRTPPGSEPDHPDGVVRCAKRPWLRRTRAIFAPPRFGYRGS